MKNIFTLFLLLASLGSLSAQIEKGNWFLGGTAGINNINSGEGSLGVTIFSVTPMTGYMLSNRFGVGANLDFTFFRYEGGDYNGSLALSPFARYYFNGSGKARFFGQAHVGIQTNLEKGADNNLSTLGYGLAVGLDYFLNDHIAIEGSLGYQLERYLETELSPAIDGFNTFSTNIGVIAFF
jgi:outer membrane protein